MKNTNYFLNKYIVDYRTYLSFDCQTSLQYTLIATQNYFKSHTKLRLLRIMKPYVADCLALYPNPWLALRSLGLWLGRAGTQEDLTVPINLFAIGIGVWYNNLAVSSRISLWPRVELCGPRKQWRVKTYRLWQHSLADTNTKQSLHITWLE